MWNPRILSKESKHTIHRALGTLDRCGNIDVGELTL